MKYQRGMTAIGWVVVLALVLSYVFIGIKIVPTYIEFFSLEKVLATMAKDPSFPAMSAKEIRESFSRRATIGYITVVGSEDLDISKENGENVVSVEYSQKIPLIYNISVVIDFSASTSNGKRTKTTE
jgi:hypothetical protein